MIIVEQVDFLAKVKEATKDEPKKRPSKWCRNASPGHLAKTSKVNFGGPLCARICARRRSGKGPAKSRQDCLKRTSERGHFGSQVEVSGDQSC